MRRFRVGFIVCGLCCLVPMSVLGQPDAKVVSDTSTHIVSLPIAVPVDSLNSEANMIFEVPFPVPGGSNSLECQGSLKRRGQYVRGPKLRLWWDSYSLDGQHLQTGSEKQRSLTPIGRYAWAYRYTSPTRFVVRSSYLGAYVADQSEVKCRVVRRAERRNDASTAYLLGNKRFGTKVWSKSGWGTVAQSGKKFAWYGLTPSQAAQVVVDMRNTCLDNEHYQVGIGSLTNESFQVVATDTLTGKTWSWDNPGANRVVVHTGAIPDCP